MIYGELEKMVDIIVPIYNAYEDLEICLESVYANTDLKKNRLILINDKSPDPRIRELLDRQLKLENKNIIVIHNNVNKGFSGNINFGMAQSSENDVLLLNSDTIVTKNWIEKIVKCAYSDEAIGTVTPLSNNATLCSVPEFCQENKLPDGMTVDKAAEIVEKCSFHEYPEISVGHGFCLYIKREVINIVGNFDAETFEKGYGEENDFCNRAGQAGYIHVMCDDTYIYHSGTKSFVSKEKQQLIDSHEKILRQRYPEQMHLNDIHVRDNPNYKIMENVKLHFELCNGKKNIMYIVQSDFRKESSDHIGGTQKHVKDLATGLCDEYNIFVAAREKNELVITFYGGEENKTFRFEIGNNHPYVLKTNRKIKQVWEQFFSIIDIDLIHIHHIKNLSFDIFDVAYDYEIPLILTMHDYYFICPTLLMLDAKNRLCIGNTDPSICVECLQTRKSIYHQEKYIEIWRTVCGEALKKCLKIIVPDESVKENVLRYYPYIDDKITVISHGYDVINVTDHREIRKTDNIKYYIDLLEKEGTLYKISGWAYYQGVKENSEIWLKMQNSEGVECLIPTVSIERGDVAVNENININCGFEAYIPNKLINGNDLEIKIWLVSEKIILEGDNTYKTKILAPKKKNIRPLKVAFIGGISEAKGSREICSIIKRGGLDVQWYIMGVIGDISLARLNYENVVKTGEYSPEAISYLLKEYEIDLVCILSICPETFSYTLSEAIANKCIPIVTNIGALERRMEKYDFGWTVNKDNIVTEVREIIKRVEINPEIIEENRKKMELVKGKSVKDMCNEYACCYKKLFSTKRRVAYIATAGKFVYEASKNIGDRPYKRKKMDGNLENELYTIKNSLSYRLAKKMSGLRIPFRNQLHRVLIKIVK